MCHKNEDIQVVLEPKSLFLLTFKCHSQNATIEELCYVSLRNASSQTITSPRMSDGKTRACTKISQAKSISRAELDEISIQLIMCQNLLPECEWHCHHQISRVTVRGIWTRDLYNLHLRECLIQCETFRYWVHSEDRGQWMNEWHTWRFGRAGTRQKTSINAMQDHNSLLRASSPVTQSYSDDCRRGYL